VGLLVNIEAIDRAGKSTQADDIIPVLEERGVSVVRMAFPDRPDPRNPEFHTVAHFPTGILVNRLLGRGFPPGSLTLFDKTDTLFRRVDHLADDLLGSVADERSPKERSPRTQEIVQAAKLELMDIVRAKMIQAIYSINRRERYEGADGMGANLTHFDVVVVERLLSGWTYGIAEGASRAQIMSLEGELPQPDITFLLDIDPSVAKNRRGEEPADFYEENLSYQAKVRELYLELHRQEGAASAAANRPSRIIKIDASLPKETQTGIIVDTVTRRLHGDYTTPLLQV
jgi:thymidylate kinase